MKTKIEWTERVWNPVEGCTKIGEGCKNCYAEVYAKRFWNGREFSDVKFRLEKLQLPFNWKKPRRIFVNSMSDLFHEKIADRQISSIFAVIKETPRHTYQILTKRTKRMAEFCIANGVPKNVWLGFSASNQKEFDAGIMNLLKTPARIKFVSLEPLLGGVDISSGLVKKRYFGNIIENAGLDWAIVGGESGRNARPMHPLWAHSIKNQCISASVPFFFKQWGTWAPFLKGAVNPLRSGKYISIDVNGKVYDEFDDEADNIFCMIKLNKKESGRLLGGRIYEGYPEN